MWISPSELMSLIFFTQLSCTVCNWVPQPLTFKNNLFQKCTVIIYSFRFCMISFCCVHWNHPTEKKNCKSRWHFFSFFLELWKLGTHHWVFTIALWVRLTGGWTVPALRGVTPGRFTVAAGQSLYNQTHSEWSVKLTHKKCNHTHTYTCTRTRALAFGTVQSHLNSTEWLITQKGERWGNSMTSSLGAGPALPHDSVQWRRRVTPAGAETGKKPLFVSSQKSHC